MNWCLLIDPLPNYTKSVVLLSAPPVCNWSLIIIIIIIIIIKIIMSTFI